MSERAARRREKHTSEKEASKQNKKQEMVEKKTKQLLKKNSCWDELEELNSMVAAVIFSPQHILPVLKNKELMENIQEEILPLANIINKDLERYHDKFRTIHDKHRDKVGNTNKMDELKEAIIISQEYIQLQESFEMVVAPNINQILEISKRESQRLEEAAKETVAVETPIEEGQENVG